MRRSRLPLLQSPTVRTLVATVCVLAATAAIAQTTLPAVRADVDLAYAGQWTPDHEANRKLEKQLRKEMRKRMAKLKPPGGGPGGDRPGGPGGMGGPGGGMPGGGMGGMGGGSGPGGGMPGGGMPPGGPPGGREMPSPNAHGLLRPEMDFAAPLQGDLLIALQSGAMTMGKPGETPVQLPFTGGAVELAGGESRAFAGWENDRLVVEINTDDGVQVTHTYSLEGDGRRMRVRTHVAGGAIPIPGGLDFERLYDRVGGEAAALR